MSDAPRAAVLISGEGTNLQALIDAGAAGQLGAQLALVVSNRALARGLARAAAAGIPARHLPSKGLSREAFDAQLGALLDEHSVDFVVLAGFMRIFSAAFVTRFAGRMLNIHPSLLPAYPGLDTHRRVLAAGERWHGATVHFVTPELDAGPRIIQYRIAVHPDDTPETLATRVHRGEHRILPTAAAWLAAGRLRLVGEAVMLDGHELSEPVIVAGDA